MVPSGFKAEAARVAAGILEAAEFFDGRLPEAFGGYPRSMTKYPVQYPTACSPQAWSTGAPLLLLATMLGLEPVGEHLLVDPALPRAIGRLELLDIPGRWGRVDAFARVGSTPRLWIVGVELDAEGGRFRPEELFLPIDKLGSSAPAHERSEGMRKFIMGVQGSGKGTQPSSWRNA